MNAKKLSANKKNIKIIFSIILVLIIVSSGIASYIVFQEPEKEDKIKEEKEIDNRISPYTEQAIFIEIKRIRANGAIEKMTDTGPLVKRVNDWKINEKGLEFPTLSKISGKPVCGLGITSMIKGSLPGIGWDEKPSFQYMAIIDDFEWKGGEFNTWDTKYIYHEFYKVVDEEQEKSKVDIKIVDKNNDKDSEIISVIYDYKTGRWSGDDKFNDTDGYGHYNGSKYEVWFDIRQTDYDKDKIPFWTEVNLLGTNPKIDDRKLDPDNDNCSTAWEWKWGYDPFKWDNHSFLDPDNDGLQNVEEEFMEEWLADPYQPEIYIECDYSADPPDERFLGFIPYKIEIKKGKIIPIKRPAISKAKYTGQEIKFWEESQAMLMERFNQHGITMHIDDGCMNEGGEKLDLISPENIKSKDYIISGYYKRNFPDERKGIFRYIVLVVLGGGWNYNMDYTGRYDTITASATDIFYSSACNGFAKTQRAQRVAQATSLLHELGHSCGYGYLHCGGVDNLTADGSAENWFDYKSVMNYLWYGCRLFDYSDGTNGENDCDDWGKIDVGFFQRAPKQYDLEGIAFDFAAPPINRR